MQLLANFFIDWTVLKLNHSFWGSFLWTERVVGCTGWVTLCWINMEFWSVKRWGKYFTLMSALFVRYPFIDWKNTSELFIKFPADFIWISSLIWNNACLKFVHNTDKLSNSYFVSFLLHSTPLHSIIYSFNLSKLTQWIKCLNNDWYDAGYDVAMMLVMMLLVVEVKANKKKQATAAWLRFSWEGLKRKRKLLPHFSSI